jgi:hypothetical protein
MLKLTKFDYFKTTKFRRLLNLSYKKNNKFEDLIFNERKIILSYMIPARGFIATKTLGTE